MRLLFVALLVCLAVPASASAADSKERVVITGPVVVERGETSGDVIVIDGDVLVRGTVDGDLFVVNGEVTLRGTVKGDLVTVSDRAVFGDRGKVEGDLHYGDKKPEGAEGKVEGDTERFKVGTATGIGVAIGFWIAITVSVFLLGLLLLLLAPRAADAVAGSGPLKSFLVGLLVFFLLPLLGLLALVTIIGIPFGIGLLLAVGPLYAIGYTSAAWIVGRRILKNKPRILAFIVGLLVLRLLALIPIAGGIVWFLATVFGLGAVTVATLRHRKA